MSKKLLIRLVAAILACWASVVVSPASTAASSQVKADQFNPCFDLGNNDYTNCATDDRLLSWCFGSSTAGREQVRDSIEWALRHLRDSTVLNLDWLENCNSTVDAQFREADIGAGTLGRSICSPSTLTQTSPRQRYCIKTIVTINAAAHTQAGNARGGGSDGNMEAGEYAFNMDLSACHELGHTVGLIHHDASWFTGQDGSSTANDCTVNQWREIELNGNGWRRMNAHHRDHIDNDTPTF